MCVRVVLSFCLCQTKHWEMFSKKNWWPHFWFHFEGKRDNYCFVLFSMNELEAKKDRALVTSSSFSLSHIHSQLTLSLVLVILSLSPPDLYLSIYLTVYLIHLPYSNCCLGFFRYSIFFFLFFFLFPAESWKLLSSITKLLPDWKCSKNNFNWFKWMRKKINRTKFMFC